MSELIAITPIEQRARGRREPAPPQEDNAADRCRGQAVHTHHGHGAGAADRGSLPRAGGCDVRTTRQFGARGNMMVALLEGVYRAATALGRAWRAWTARFSMSRRDRAHGV